MSPYCGKQMDRKRNARIRRYLDTTWCETHWRKLAECGPLDASCMVCGCGGLCDSMDGTGHAMRCSMQRRPNP